VENSIAAATLKPKEERRLLRGHLWAYRNEFKQLPEIEDGALVDVFSSERRFVGRGFYQASGGIAARLLSRHQTSIDAAFLEARIAMAKQLREVLFPDSRVYRWVFGESDGLPGLVADRYNGLVCVQSSCAFYNGWRDTLAAAFLATEGVIGVQIDIGGVLESHGEVPAEIVFELEGLHLGFAPDQRQKTGFFLDQRLNSLSVGAFARGARVLDGHCYLGQWSCHAARAGAAAVLGVDSSAAAIEQARANAVRNGVDAISSFECRKIEEVLAEEETYDVIVIDPPAFAKSRAQTRRALDRYRALNTAAFGAVTKNGYLFTSSCSHFVTQADFLDMLKQAAAAARRSVCLLELRGAAPDHPVLLSMPETAYLKCAVLRVL
jgi:23S rRNA (cytosine1962-C5)-methyltransferase